MVKGADQVEICSTRCERGGRSALESPHVNARLRHDVRDHADGEGDGEELHRDHRRRSA